MSSNFLNFLLLAQQFSLLRMMLQWLLSKQLMIPGLWINNLWFVQRPTFWVWTSLWSCLRRKSVITLRKLTSPNPWYKHSWLQFNKHRSYFVVNLNIKLLLTLVYIFLLKYFGFYTALLLVFMFVCAQFWSLKHYRIVFVLYCVISFLLMFEWVEQGLFWC